MKNLFHRSRITLLAAALALGATTSMSYAATAILEITLNVAPENRAAAAKVYETYKGPFLKTVAGALAKRLLIRTDDVQVLHEFTSTADAQGYLKSDLFTKDVVGALTPLLASPPDVRIYEAN